MEYEIQKKKNRSALILKSTIQITVQKKWKHQQKVCTKFDGTYMQGKHEIHSEWECSDAKKQDLLFVQTNKTETSFAVIHMLGIRTHNFRIYSFPLVFLVLFFHSPVTITVQKHCSWNLCAIAVFFKSIFITLWNQ